MRIDQYQGADAVGLEEKIKQHLENDPGSNEDTDIPKGYVCHQKNKISILNSVLFGWIEIYCFLINWKYFQMRIFKTEVGYWVLSVCYNCKSTL